MSLCDKCPAPGQCCRRMWLSSTETGFPRTVWSDDPNGSLIAEGLPFRHLETVETFTDEENSRQYETALFMCSALGKDGRCTIYETRPQLCRDYREASDPLCVFHGGLEAGDASA